MTISASRSALCALLLAASLPAARAAPMLFASSATNQNSIVAVLTGAGTTATASAGSYSAVPVRVAEFVLSFDIYTGQASFAQASTTAAFPSTSAAGAPALTIQGDK